MRHVTTKDVEVKYIDEGPPFEAPKNKPVTTRDHENIAEKNKRAKVMAEKEALAWPDDVLIGILETGAIDPSHVELFDEAVGLFDPDWKKEPVGRKKR